MKRFLLTFAVLMVSITAALAEVLSGSCGTNVTYTLDTETGVLKIEGTGEMSDYSSYSAPWYSRRSYVKEAQIAQGVTSIGKDAFEYCSSLTSITIPGSVTSIGERAFYDCSSLTSIIIPESVTSIGDYAFFDCSSLTSINIPESVTSIGSIAFYGCSSLTSITIPESVTSIGERAFQYCRSLTSISIPESVTSIGDYAFSSCSSLTSIIIPNSVTSIGDYAFSSCSSLTAINIPEGMTSIGSQAFRGCSALTSITIPEGVTSIGSSAFSGCTNMIELKYNAINATLSSEYTTFPYGLKKVTIGSNVEKIPTVFVYNNSNLTDIIIPESVTSIGDYAFSSCSSLTSITIPERVTSIGVSVFEGCNNLTELIYNAKNATVAEATDSDRSFPTSLTSVTIGENVESIPAYFINSNTNLKNITIPNSVTSIGSYAFEYCSSLTSITIPNSVTSIGNRAFYGCSSLTSITIPEGVTSIGSYAFIGCSILMAIFEGSKPSISSYAFSNRSSYDFDIKNVVVPAHYYQDYAALRYSGTTRLFPSDGIVFAEAPTRELYLEKMASVGKAAQTSITFACDNLEDNLDEDVIKSAINPNCLIYVPEGCGITGDNFVEMGNGSATCKSLSLTDGYPFACIPIECEEVVYVHHPSVWANGKSGWETLCLPFSPTSIRASESGYLSPIVLGGNGNFWLRKYVGSSSTSVFFTSTADGVMEANTPYLVAFPGKSMGAGHLEGEAITFSTSNVTIDGYASPEPIKKNAFAFKANYNGIPEAEQGYELNAEGSSFVQSVTVGNKPFQAYFTNDELTAGSSVKSLKIDFGTFNDETGIFEVEEGSGMQPGTAGTFYDLSGRRISQGSAKQKGIYISNGRKVIKL